jgi:hypothetical protein
MNEQRRGILVRSRSSPTGEFNNKNYFITIHASHLHPQTAVRFKNILWFGIIKWNDGQGQIRYFSGMALRAFF